MAFLLMIHYVLLIVLIVLIVLTGFIALRTEWH
jgi:hypothetical protein